MATSDQGGVAVAELERWIACNPRVALSIAIALGLFLRHVTRIWMPERW